ATTSAAMAVTKTVIWRPRAIATMGTLARPIAVTMMVPARMPRWGTFLAMMEIAVQPMTAASAVPAQEPLWTKTETVYPIAGTSVRAIPLNRHRVSAAAATPIPIPTATERPTAMIHVPTTGQKQRRVYAAVGFLMRIRTGMAPLIAMTIA